MVTHIMLKCFLTKHIGGLANRDLTSPTNTKEIDVASQLKDQHQLRLNKQINLHPSLVVDLIFFSFFWYYCWISHNNVLILDSDLYFYLFLLVCIGV